MIFLWRIHHRLRVETNEVLGVSFFSFVEGEGKDWKRGTRSIVGGIEPSCLYQPLETLSA